MVSSSIGRGIWGTVAFLLVKSVGGEMLGLSAVVGLVLYAVTAILCAVFGAYPATTAGVGALRGLLTLAVPVVVIGFFNALASIVYINGSFVSGLLLAVLVAIPALGTGALVGTFVGFFRGS